LKARPGRAGIEFTMARFAGRSPPFRAGLLKNPVGNAWKFLILFPEKTALLWQIRLNEIVKMLARLDVLSAALGDKPWCALSSDRSPKKQTQQIFQLVAHCFPIHKSRLADQEMPVCGIGANGVQSPMSAFADVKSAGD
jgi:hypothetical protein